MDTKRPFYMSPVICMPNNDDNVFYQTDQSCSQSQNAILVIDNVWSSNSDFVLVDDFVVESVTEITMKKKESKNMKVKRLVKF